MKVITIIASLCLALNTYAVLPAPEGGYPNYNTALGDSALFNLDTSLAAYNTALGDHAMYWAVDCEANTAIGAFALINNTTGSFNVAVGDDALDNNTTGSFSTAVGTGSLDNVTTGSNNIGIGNFAGSQLTTENYNIDIGNVGVIGDQGVIRIGQKGQQTKTCISGIYDVTIANNTHSVVIRSNGQLGSAPVSLEELMNRIAQLERQVAQLTSKQK